MKIELQTNATQTDAIVIEAALQAIALNLNKQNIVFIAELSRKKDINKKLESKKSLIKSYI